MVISMRFRSWRGSVSLQTRWHSLHVPTQGCQRSTLLMRLYRIRCSYGEVYMGTMKCSICTHFNEHRGCCHLGQPEKAATVEYTLTHNDHTIFIAEMQVLFMTRSYFTLLYWETIKIRKHASNYSESEEGLALNMSWFPALNVVMTTKPMRRDDWPNLHLSLS